MVHDRLTEQKKEEIASINDPDDRILGYEETRKWRQYKKLAAKHREAQRKKAQGEGWVDERPSVEIHMQEYDLPLVEFKYAQPNISVDKSVRYAEHKVLGGTTVRQKLGEDPPEISVEGICTSNEANRIDEMSASDVVELISHRWEGEAQIASTSTNPFDDGGARDTDQEWLHQFTIELVALDETSTPDAPGSGGGGGGGGTGPGAFHQE